MKIMIMLLRSQHFLQFGDALQRSNKIRNSANHYLKLHSVVTLSLECKFLPNTNFLCFAMSELYKMSLYFIEPAKSTVKILSIE